MRRAIPMVALGRKTAAFLEYLSFVGGSTTVPHAFNGTTIGPDTVQAAIEHGLVVEYGIQNGPDTVTEVLYVPTQLGIDSVRYGRRLDGEAQEVLP